MKPYITTYTGKRFHPFDPSPDEICIEDISHALSLVNRFGGHTRVPYSVASHSLMVSRNVRPDCALAGLLHDATEAYMVDIPKPLKKGLHEYVALETYLEEMIFAKFLCTPTEEQRRHIKEIDMRALRTEMEALMHSVPEDVLYFEPLAASPQSWIPEPPGDTAREFHYKFKLLTGGGL